MKRFSKVTVVILAAFFVGLTALPAQSTVQGLLRKYNNNKDVLAFNLTGDLDQLFHEAAGGAEIQSKIDNLSVLVFDKEDDVTSSDQVKIRELLDKQGFESLINVRGEGNSGYVRIYALDSGDHIEQLYAQVLTEGRSVYATLSGKILYEDITKINTAQFKDLSSLMDN